MLHRRAGLASILLLVACSPASAPPVVPAPKLATAPKPLPEPSAPMPGARWIFADEPPKANAQLEADGAVVQVGADGRRWRTGKTGDVEQAQFLVAPNLVDLRREGAAWLFLGDDGTVLLADDPLGKPREIRKGPRDGAFTTKAHFTIGRAALLGVERDGTFHRSTDAGVTWSHGRLPIVDGEVVAALAANARGEVVAVVHPQRILASINDGTSWFTVSSPGIGADAVVRDAGGDLYLRGFGARRFAVNPPRFEGGTFAALAAPKKEPKPPGRAVHAGDRIVTWATEPEPLRQLEVRVDKLGGAPGAPSVLPVAASPNAMIRVAGHREHVVVAIVEPTSLRLFRTSNEGKSWQALGVLEGKESGTLRLGVAPDWVAVDGFCGEAGCPPRFKYGNGSFQPLGLPPKAQLLHVAFDSARDRVVVAAREGTTTAIYAGARFAPLDKVAALAAEDPRAFAVLDDGSVRVAFERPLRIETLRADMTRGPTAFLPPEMTETWTHVALSGARGLVFHDKGTWETADGGEHWARVPAIGSSEGSCSESGCKLGDAVRVGWDLPDPRLTLLASPTQPPASAAKAKVTSPASLEMTCKTTGPWKTHAGSLDSRMLSRDVRLFATVDGKDAYEDSIVIARGAAAPKEVRLLDKLSLDTKPEPFAWSRIDSGGVVLARSTQERIIGNYGAYWWGGEVDLGWYVASTGKTHKAKLPAVKSFQPKKFRVGAMLTLVEGGLLFLADERDTGLFFVRDDGKIEEWSRPDDDYRAPFRQAVKVGKRIVVKGEDRGSVVLAMSDDTGKTWRSKVWTLGSSAQLTVLDGKPALVFGDDAVTAIAFASLTNDPPPAIRWPRAPQLVSANGLVACGPKASGVLADVHEDPSSAALRVTVDGDDAKAVFETRDGVVRLRGDATACVESVRAHEDGGRQLLLSTADPKHAWLARSASKKGDSFEARPLECALPK